MDILYLSNLCSDKEYGELFKNSSTFICQQSQKFNRLLASGLSENGCNVTVLSSRVVNRNVNKQLIFNKKTETAHGVNFVYLPFMNVRFVRQLCLYQTAKKEIKKWLKNNPKGVIICDILNYSLLKALHKVTKKKTAKKIAVITDVPEILYQNARNLVKKTNKMIEACNNFVFLTEAMADKFNIGNKKYCVIEGLCETNEIKEGIKQNVVLYAGTLHKNYGIKAMVEGFAQANIKNYELHIYGTGDWQSEVEQICKSQSNIKYFGTKPNSYVVSEQQKAMLLVNPRPIDEEYAKYSFPSKIMEYIVSGTATLTTNIPSLLEEYKQHCFVVNESSSESFAKAFKEILSLPISELISKGKNARQWIIKDKSSKQQAKKLLDCLMLEGGKNDN